MRISIYALLFAFMTMQACSLIHKITHKEHTKKTTVTHSDSMGKESITETTTVDTTVTIKADTARTEAPIADLLGGKDITIDNHAQSVTAHYNAKSKSIELTAEKKPETVTIQEEKTTHIERTAEVRKQEKQKVNDWTKTAQKTVEPIFHRLWIWLIIAALVVLAFIFFRKHFKLL